MRTCPLERTPAEPTPTGPSEQYCERPPPAMTSLQAHSTYITKCLISPDRKRLATTSSDHSIKIWDMANNFREEKILNGHQRWVWDAAFSADSAYLVTASSDQTARLWDVAQARHCAGHGPGRPDRPWLVCHAPDC